jgi:hypothetical protein
MEQYNNVDELIKRLPESYESECYASKAIIRKREIKTPYDLIKAVLLYVTGGYTLLEMSVILESLGIGKVSDTAFMNKFANSAEWLSKITMSIVPKPIIEYAVPLYLLGRKIIGIDASDVTTKGKVKETYTLHYAINILKLCAESFKITSEKVGEKLQNFNLSKEMVVLADRAYGTLSSLQHCLKQEADFIVRLKYNAFTLYNEAGKKIDLLKEINDVGETAAKDITVFAKFSELGLKKLRICLIRIPNDEYNRVERARKASNDETSYEARLLRHYVVLITSLPIVVSADSIITLYRLRWQIELYFKRLKSILDFGNVPVRREDSVFAWLNAKLLVSLLVEEMIAEVSFSPSGH